MPKRPMTAGLTLVMVGSYLNQARARCVLVEQALQSNHPDRIGIAKNHIREARNVTSNIVCELKELVEDIERDGRRVLM